MKERKIPEKGWIVRDYFFSEQIGRLPPVSFQFPDNQKFEAVRHPLNEIMERPSSKKLCHKCNVNDF